MPKTKPVPSAEELIRATGVKVTLGRVRVLELLSHSDIPLSHADLDMALSTGDETPMDRVTLYRVLDALVAKGLAVKSIDANGVFRYAGAATRQRHQGHVHFHCLDCGGRFCLKAKPPQPPRLPRGFRLREIEFDVRGTCPECTDSTSLAEKQ
jgi:Fur family ferric uptake transcriptional regulator